MNSKDIEINESLKELAFQVRETYKAACNVSELKRFFLADCLERISDYGGLKGIGHFYKQKALIKRKQKIQETLEELSSN